MDGSAASWTITSLISGVGDAVGTNDANNNGR